MLADGDGMLVLANRWMEEIFGYQQDDLAGHPVESLIPADLHMAHHSHRADYAQAPETRPKGAGARLVGLRKKTEPPSPVEISLNPIPTTTGQLTLAVIRDVNQTRRHDLLDMARAAVAADQAHRPRRLGFQFTAAPEGGHGLAAAGRRAEAGRRVGGVRSRSGSTHGPGNIRRLARIHQGAAALTSPRPERARRR